MNTTVQPTAPETAQQTDDQAVATPTTQTDDEVIVVEAPEIEGEDFYPGIMGLSASVNGKLQFKQWCPYFFPVLHQVDAAFPQPKDWIQVEVTVKGNAEKMYFASPRYESEQVQFLFDSLLSTIQDGARNRAKNPENEQPDNWTDLLTAKDSTKYGTQLKLFKETFAKWLALQNMPQKRKVGIINRMKDDRELSGKSFALRQKLLPYFDQYRADTDTSEFGGAIRKYTTVLNKPDDDDSFLDD